MDTYSTTNQSIIPTAIRTSSVVTLVYTSDTDPHRPTDQPANRPADRTALRGRPAAIAAAAAILADTFGTAPWLPEPTYCHLEAGRVDAACAALRAAGIGVRKVLEDDAEVQAAFAVEPSPARPGFGTQTGGGGEVPRA